MKKILSLFTVAVFLVSFAGCSYIYPDEETYQQSYNQDLVHITIDNRSEVMNKPLEKIDGHILVPVMEFSKLIRAIAYWDNEANTVSAWRGEYGVEFNIGEQQYWFGTTWAASNGTLDIAPIIIDDTIYVPLRIMAEKLDLSVIWEEDNKTISLTDKKTEHVVGHANTFKLFLDEIEKNVEKMVSEFTIITENIPVETFEIDIRDYFDDIEMLEYLYREMEDEKISITYKLRYRMHARILHAHRIKNTDDLDERELSVYKKALQIVSEQTVAYMTDYEKELSLHDYIVKNTKYSYEALEAIQRGEDIEEESTPYGTLINGSAVCSGYSSAFKLLMELSGIECDTVYGIVGEELHEWNRVKLAGEYYLVDVTWNDRDDERMPDFVSYEYFNLTDKKMSQDHTTTSVSDKKANATLYNYYNYNKLFAK